MTDPTNLSYAQASSELETILKDLESDRLDVDEIVVKTQRASELIEICRSKINGAKMMLENINSNRGV